MDYSTAVSPTATWILPQQQLCGIVYKMQMSLKSVILKVLTHHHYVHLCALQKQQHQGHGWHGCVGRGLFVNVTECGEIPGIFHMSISYQQGIHNNSCLTDLSIKAYLRIEATIQNKQTIKTVVVLMSQKGSRTT